MRLVIVDVVLLFGRSLVWLASARYCYLIVTVPVHAPLCGQTKRNLTELRSEPVHRMSVLSWSIATSRDKLIISHLTNSKPRRNYVRTTDAPHQLNKRTAPTEVPGAGRLTCWLALVADCVLANFFPKASIILAVCTHAQIERTITSLRAARLF